MTPYQTIENLKKEVANLKYELKYSKNKQKDAKRINTIITVLNEFDDMLLHKYKTDAVNRLIYGLILEYYKRYNVGSGGEIPLYKMIDEIDNTLAYDAEYKKLEIISQLKTNYISNLIKKNEIELWNFEYPDFEFMLSDLLTQFKTTLKWNL